MGGGNADLPGNRQSAAGLSPRGRGKLDRPLTPGKGHGSIPAWAGETPRYSPSFPVARVYPRVGGGNLLDEAPLLDPEGLSPRGRGKPPRKGWRFPGGWSIPAWAGETHIGRGMAGKRPVYPRVGGGNHSQSNAACWVSGLSPRGRGKPNVIDAVNGHNRSIPAWAGETCDIIGETIGGEVYPRVGGGNVTDCYYHSNAKGLSPRGRGKLFPGGGAYAGERSIPAWAGETQPRRKRDSRRPVYPRVGGGN